MERVTVKPDLYLRLGVGDYTDHWSIEVDCATESGATIARKAAVYLAEYRSGEVQRAGRPYPRVLWVVPDERRARQVNDALRTMPRGTHGLFATATANEAVTLLAGEVAS